MANRPASHYPNIGALGEDLVALWLQSTGWTILHRRWRCRWGEVDIVAKTGDRIQDSEFKSQNSELTSSQNQPYAMQNQNWAPDSLPTLAFVEVKTRSRGNWDAGGLLAITPQKQAKLWQTAQFYLTTYPDLAEHACRFDVALVQYRKLPNTQPSQLADIKAATGLLSSPVQLGQAITTSGYQLVLQEYLASAFD